MISERHAIETRAGLIYVGLDDADDVDIKVEFNEDSACKIVLSPAEAVRLANTILGLS